MRAGRLIVAVALGAVVGIVFSVALAAFLTRAPLTPLPAGSARILVPADDLNSGDRFQLRLAIGRPSDTQVQYHVVVGCGATLPEVLLMLSGDARVHHVDFALSRGLQSTVRSARVGWPWFQAPEEVQLIYLPVQHEPCPPGVVPDRFSTVSVVNGVVSRSFETSSGYGHALQLPQVGDQTQFTTAVPAFGGSWGAPPFVSIYVGTGGLPLETRIDSARPNLTGSGGLTWKGDGFILASATWTDIESEHFTQFILFVLGALVGICGSLLAAIGFDWVRQRRQRHA